MSSEILEVSITDILPGENQPRKTRPENNDIELATSIIKEKTE